MTVKQVTQTSPNWPPTAEGKLRSGWALLLIGAFAIATLWLTRPVTPVQGISPVAGLLTLKASAQTAMPYGGAISNHQPTLIEFYADWCTTCQGLAPTLAALHQQYGPALNFVMLNIDDPQWRDQIERYGVTGVPHVVLQDGQGTIRETFIGNVPRSVLAQRIQALL